MSDTDPPRMPSALLVIRLTGHYAGRCMFASTPTTSNRIDGRLILRARKKTSRALADMSDSREAQLVIHYLANIPASQI